MEITPPLVDCFFAIPALKATLRMSGELFPRGGIIHAARAGKIGGRLGAIAHPDDMRRDFPVLKRTNRINPVISLPYSN
jgi:hypothetical protein